MPPSITWATLKAEIGRRLNDTSHSSYGADLLLDLVNDALRHLASAHTGLASDFTITGDGTTYAFSLPSNIVDSENSGVYAVQWTEQRWLEEQPYWHGMQFPSSSRDTGSSPNAYTLWPVDRISFGRVPGSGDTVTLHYIAYYPRVIGDTSTILVPVWAREALKCYVCGQAMCPGATKAAKLRQYQSRREAGKPEDNPLRVQGEAYMLRYYQMLAEHPRPQYRQDVSAEDFR